MTRKKRLAVAACLNEVLRILVLKAPYDDNNMIEILHLIVDNFQSLDDFSSDPFGRRSTILENYANVKVCNLLLDLEFQNLVYDIFHHFLVTIKEDHDTKTLVAMESLMILCIEEMDEVTQTHHIMLWVVRNLEYVPSIVACRLVSNVFKHCEEKLIFHLHKWEKMVNNNKGDALHEENEGMIIGLLQEDLLNISSTPTWGEHQKNEEVVFIDLMKKWIDQVVSISEIVPEVVPIIEFVSIIEVVSVTKAQSFIDVVFIPKAMFVTEAMSITEVIFFSKVVCFSPKLCPSFWSFPSPRLYMSP